MKTTKIITSIILILSVGFACQPDKKAQLDQLKKQQAELSAKIKKLETEIAASDTTKKDDSKVRQVSSIDIKPETFKHYIEVQGRLDGEDNLDVYPEAMGIVESVNVSNGQAVSKGQVLARLNDAAVREQIKAQETKYQLSKETYEKQERLWNQKIGSELQYLQAKAGRDADEAQLAALRKQLDMMTIKAPISGTVEDVNVKVGQTASPQMPAFRVMNFGSLKVKADVAEAYSSKINIGDDVIVFFPDLNKEIPAKVNTASRYINPINRTFQIEVRLNPEKNGYKANMVAVLKVIDYKANNAIVVPVNLIQTDPTGNFIYVVNKNGKEAVAKKTYIKQGQSYNGTVEITDGLKAGDKVITSGYLDLEEGEAIKL